MSEPNVNITLPSSVTGGRTVNKIDHGPFYLFSPALPIHRVWANDSVPHVYPCTVTICTDWAEHLPEQQCPPGTVIEWSEVKDQVGTVTKFGLSLIPADPIRRSIVDDYSPWGLKEITSLAHRKDGQDVNIATFNSILYPVKVEPSELLNDELFAEVAQVGGLAVRKRLVETGLKFISSPMFANEYGTEQQRLYKDAATECLISFIDATKYVTNELNDSDSSIRLAYANAGGKPGYDPRDTYMQWLLARTPVMETQRQSPTQVVVQGAGLSKEDLLEVMVKASEHAAQMALASAEQTKVSKPAKPAKKDE